MRDATRTRDALLWRVRRTAVGGPMVTDTRSPEPLRAAATSTSLLLGALLSLVACTTPTQFASEPSGALVEVNGIPRGTTPCTLDLDLEGCASYTARFRKDGFEPELVVVSPQATGAYLTQSTTYGSTQSYGTAWASSYRTPMGASARGLSNASTYGTANTVETSVPVVAWPTIVAAKLKPRPESAVANQPAATPDFAPRSEPLSSATSLAAPPPPRETTPRTTATPSPEGAVAKPPGRSGPQGERLACSACGASMPLGAKFCGACGTAVAHRPADKTKQFCTQCGREFTSDDRFCRGCGAPRSREAK